MTRSVRLPLVLVALMMCVAPTVAADAEFDVFAKACVIKREAGKKTDLQTKHAYKQLVGMPAKVRFRAVKVYEAMLADFAVDGVTECGIKVSCMIDGGDVDALLAISKGDEVTCTGTASSVSGSSIWLKEASVSK